MGFLFQIIEYLFLFVESLFQLLGNIVLVILGFIIGLVGFIIPIDNDSNVEKADPEIEVKQEQSANKKIDTEHEAEQPTSEKVDRANQVKESINNENEKGNSSNNSVIKIDQKNIPEQESNDQNNQLKKKKLNIEKMITSLQKNQKEEVASLKEKYLKMYNEEYPAVAREIEKIGYQNHEEFLRDCENNFMEVCSKLHHVAKLSYYMEKLEEKRREIEIKILKLKQNRWDIERRIELSQVFSTDELENIENLLKDTRNLINSQISVPEKQDVASIEKNIVEDILSNRVK